MDCFTKADDTVKVSSKSVRKTEESYNEATVLIEFNTNSFKNSLLWDKSEDTLRFCIKTELVYDSDISVVFDDTIIDVAFDTSADFIISDTLSGVNDMNFDELSKGFENNACLCNSSFICDNTLTFAMGSEVEVCVLGPAGLIVRVDEMSFLQDGIEKMKSVKNGRANGISSKNLGPISGINPSIKDYQKLKLSLGDIPSTEKDEKLLEMLKTKTNSVESVRTRMISTFFENSNPSPLTVKGKATYLFPNAESSPSQRRIRRHLRAERRVPDNGGIEEEQTTFEFKISLEPSTDHTFWDSVRIDIYDIPTGAQPMVMIIISCSVLSMVGFGYMGYAIHKQRRARVLTIDI